MSMKPDSEEQRGGTLRVVLSVALVAVLAGGTVVWLRSLHWPIEVVQIDGETRHVDREEMRDVVIRYAHQGFFGLDLAALRGALEALPWVRRATLRRVWPDTLQVDVREHRPAARWNDDSLISERGVVFRPATAGFDELPHLYGPDGQAVAMLLAYDDYSGIVAALDFRILVLRQDARRSWEIDLVDGPVLQLGRESPEKRLRRLMAAWPVALAGRDTPIRSIDLRYPNGFAVAWRNDAGDDSPEGGV